MRWLPSGRITQMSEPRPPKPGPPTVTRWPAHGEEDPVAARAHHRHLVRAGETAGQADPLGAVERRAVDLVRAVAILVARQRVVPDDVRRVDPVGRLADEVPIGLDDEGVGEGGQGEEQRKRRANGQHGLPMHWPGGVSQDAWR
ncbi:MAG: hypothetical protein U0802_20030 [Candidatus Binatia bacterium]